MNRAVWIAFGLVVGCSSCGEDQARPSPVLTDLAAPEPPADLLATVTLGATALPDLAQALEAPVLRALLPGSNRELVSGIDASPRPVDENTPIKIAFVGEWHAPRIAVGFSSNGRRASVASDPQLLEETRDWLVEVDEVEGVDVAIEDQAMVGLKRTLDRAIDEQVRAARIGIRREATRHEEPPAFGDPSALVDWVAQRLAAYVAFLPDVHDVRISVRFDPLRVEGSARARESTPAAAALEEEGFTGLPALPAGAAIAWWRASPRPGWAQLLEVTAADRLSESDRERVRALSDQKTDGVLLAFGYDEEPYATLRSPHEAFEIEPLLNVPHVRTLLEHFRCDRVPRVVLGRRLCPDGPFVRFAGDEGGHVFAVTDRTDLGFNGPAEHAMTLIPIRASGFILLDASRVVAASGLWREDAPSTTDGETPVTLHWEAEAPELRFEAHFARGSLAALADAIMAATDP